MTGGSGWEDAYKKAKEMVGKMTNDEKVSAKDITPLWDSFYCRIS